MEIRIEDLHKSFAGRAVLRGVDLDVRRGDVLALVGRSGCGKSVLLNLVLGLLRPDRGRILVADRDLAGTPPRERSSLPRKDQDRIYAHWGVVFQRNALFTGSVYDNLALGLREVRGQKDREIRPIAQAALASVGLPADKAFLDCPHEELSGGMAKRLAVARAIATDPDVVFYDEPTTGLDPVSAAQIHELILRTHWTFQSASGGRTSVIVTHDKDLLHRLRPRTVMLHDGRVCFDGAFEDFEASRSAIIRPYFEVMPLLNRQQPLPLRSAAR